MQIQNLMKDVHSLKQVIADQDQELLDAKRQVNIEK